MDEAARAEELLPSGLRDIHRALLARSIGARGSGEVRDTQNWIGGNDYNPCGADYVPPPPEELAPLLDDLCAFANDDLLPPLLQAAAAHAQFETIHPFEDGNGRTGRALVQVILRRRRLAPTFVPPISVVFSQRRGRYIEGLVAFREGRVAEWVSLFAAATAQAARLAQHYGDLVGDLQQHWRRRLRETVNPRADASSWAIIDALPAHPVVTVAAAVASTGRTPPAVNGGVEQLQRAGRPDPADDVEALPRLGTGRPDRPGRGRWRRGRCDGGRAVADHASASRVARMAARTGSGVSRVSSAPCWMRSRTSGEQG